MNEHLDWDLYFSQLKKKFSLWDWASGKNKTFYSKAIIKNPLLFIIILLKFNIWLPDMG